MRQEIRDDAAIAFANGFYLALGYECPLEKSYDFGCNAIQIEISGSSVSRSAVSEEQRKLEVVNVVEQTVIPEHLKPIIKNKANPTPFTDPFGSSLDKDISPHTQLGIQLEIDRALKEEPVSLKGYREQVREVLKDAHKLTDIEDIQLNLLREKLQFSVEEAKKKLEEEQAPIRQAQQDYKKMLTTLIQRGSYPFNQEIRKELKEFQDKNNLTEREVEEISQPILKAAEVEYQEKLRQRYTQEFKRVIDAGYPIDEVARSELKNFQQSLGLSDENVASVEQPIIAPKEAEYRQRLEAERLRQEQEKAKYENNRRQYEQELLKSLQQSLGLKGEHVVGIEQLVLRRYTYDDLSSEKGVDYTRLQDLLKAGQWQQADRETKSAMLKAVGGVLEGGLSFKSIKNFPYTDLLTIDRLWVKYSNGRFGFSVQKKSGKKLTGITELLLIA